VRAGYIGLHSAEARLHGQLTVLPGVSFVSFANLFFENNTFVFPNYPIISNATFWNSNVTFALGYQRASYANLISSTVTINGNATMNQNYSNFIVDQNSTLTFHGVAGALLTSPNITGTLYISSSSVTISGYFNAPLIVSGASSFTATTLILYSVLEVPSPNGQLTNVNITADILHTFGTVEIPTGYLQVNKYAYFSGEFMTEGSLLAYGDVYVDDYIYIYTFIRVESPNPQSPSTFELGPEASLTTVHLSIGPNSILRTNFSTIASDFIHLHVNSSLHHHDNSEFVGFLLNEGRIGIRSSLNWAGNFTQEKTGILEFGEIDLINRTAGLLSVLGQLTLGGTLSYNVSVENNNNGKIELAVINATTISGKFDPTPMNIGALHSSKSSLSYSANSVYLVFEKKEKKTAWYVWFLVALALAIAASVLAFYFSKKRRNAYNQLPSS